MKTYHTEGVCSTQINFETADGILTQVTFEGGCEGNLKAIGALVQGMRIEDVIEKLKGITCESTHVLRGPASQGAGKRTEIVGNQEIDAFD